jgi:ribosomal protein S12 methylthiotransferase accessory factor
MTEAREGRPLFIELDFASEEGRGLQQSVAERFGSRIVEAASLAGRMFLLRSPWAPGLRFVGAETKSSVLSEDGAMRPFSLCGSGETIEEAFVSCVGEGIDRLTLIECPGDVATVASMTQIPDGTRFAAVGALEQAFADRALARDTPIAWIAGRQVNPSADANAAREVLFPADWSLRRSRDEMHLSPLSALSVGVAAGPTYEWAASRAILELIERDAASLWWIGGRRGKVIPLDQPGITDVTMLFVKLRQQATRRVSWLLDITTDIGIPVVVALSCDLDGRCLSYGLAARLSVDQAARAAILELCQTELAILLAEIKRMEIGDIGLSPADQLHLQRGASIDANRCALLHPVGVQHPRSITETGSELSTILTSLQVARIEVALMKLTRPEFGIPVVRAVAPELQLMPSGFVTDRLRGAIAEFGGGDQHTMGIKLI